MTLLPVTHKHLILSHRHSKWCMQVMIEATKLFPVWFGYISPIIALALDQHGHVFFRRFEVIVRISKVERAVKDGQAIGVADVVLGDKGGV